MALPAADPRRAAELLAALEASVGRVIVGKSEVIRLAAATLVAGGHLLLEDLPGTGKTMLARAFAASIDAQFRRLQCTPDLLPADITGAGVFNQAAASFEFIPGPVFANVLLADEVNRATPRTQSALLEAMGEGQVTVEGVTHALPRPFFVIATQNPAEFAGTYPLPESQLDRFLVATAMGPPSRAEAERILADRQHRDPIADLEPVLTCADVEDLQAAALAIVVGEAVRGYIAALVEAIRQRPEVVVPASMRAALALQRAAQALALFDGRDYVIPDDVKSLLGPALAHRLSLRGRLRATDLLAEVVGGVPVPPVHRR